MAKSPSTKKTTTKTTTQTEVKKPNNPIVSASTDEIDKTTNTQQTTTNDIVYVGCKLPHGLVIEVQGKKITLGGRNSARIMSNYTYGITAVDRTFWEEWLKTHKTLRCVANGFVFAQESSKSVQAEALEKKAEKTGSEQIKPEDDDKVTPVEKE